MGGYANYSTSRAFDPIFVLNFPECNQEDFKCGYSVKVAEWVIMRSGLYHGSKDAVSNVVDGALALLSRENIFGTCKPFVFEDLPSLVNYTLLEMICVLREG